MADEKQIEKTVATEENTELLKQILESNKKTEKYTKWQFIVSAVRSVATVLILGVAVYFVASTADDIKLISEQAQVTLESIDTAMKSADEVAKELSSLDIEGTLDNMNEFLVESKDEVAEAMLQIQGIDIDGLNKAIADLEATVSPLAKLFGKR